MTGKPTDETGTDTVGSAVTPSSAPTPLGDLLKPPDDPSSHEHSLDETDRQNLLDTHAAPPRRPGEHDVAIATPEPAPAAPEAEPADDETEGGWFETTQPPPDQREVEPIASEPAPPADRATWVLVGVAVLVVVVLGGLVLLQ
ncbi:MAG: hypothetical protein R3F59_05015 [Myxococcota bacterium]